LRTGLRKNVAIGFSPEEFLRLKGAAALARMPVSTYVKWLLGSPVSQRELISKNLKERGIPSSTIRQVDIVLDELEKGR
jgi:hypothetical protein